jgi:3-deoxy-7-phosphoheptulonate synthase
VVGDPSHSTGNRELVVPVSLGAVAAGADGLIIEVHPNPEVAKCDGAQSLTFALFNQVMDGTRAIHAALKQPVPA